MIQPKIRIAVIQRIFSNYRQSIFDLLNKRYALKVFHSKNRSGIPQVSTQYSSIVPSFQYSSKVTGVFLFISRILYKFNPDIIIHEFNPSIISLTTSFIYARIFKKKFIVWGHGYNRNTGFNPKKVFRDKIRFWFLKNSDAVIVYGQQGKEKLSEFITKGKIFVAQNTINTTFHINQRLEFEKKGKDRIKKELGIKHKYNLIFIGRLLKEKQPEVLLEIYSKLNKGIKSETAVHIIGDGVMYKEIKRKVVNNQLENSIFLHGRIDNDVLSGKYLFVSDLLINPGHLGLSVNHAFCYHTPVISLDDVVLDSSHSPEVEYIVNYRTGYLAQNIKELLFFVEDYLINDKKQYLMKKEINDCLNNKCSLTSMENGFVEAIKYCTGEKDK